MGKAVAHADQGLRRVEFQRARAKKAQDPDAADEQSLSIQFSRVLHSRTAASGT
jgi:hypothetical protein